MFMGKPIPFTPCFQTDIVVGGDKFLVLSREEGTILVSNKALGSKVRHASEEEIGRGSKSLLMSMGETNMRHPASSLAPCLSYLPVNPFCSCFHPWVSRSSDCTSRELHVVTPFRARSMYVTYTFR